MSSFLSNILSRDRTLWRFVAICTAASFFVCAIAGIYFWAEPLYPPSLAHNAAAANDRALQILEYKTFLQKANWWPYPFFFLLIGIVVHLSWIPFQDAWSRAAERDRPIIVSDEDRPLSSDQKMAVTDRLEVLRTRAFIVALLIGFLWTASLDAPDLVRAHTATSFADQLAPALKDPDFFYRWLFEVDPRIQDAPVSAPSGQVVLTILLNLLQSALIGLGFLVLFQCLIQVATFNHLDSLSFDGFSAKIRLDHRDPLRSFGLGDWNAALDSLYWMIALGLSVPLMSMRNQPTDEKDLPQLTGVWVLGLLVALPFVATVFGRRQWLHHCRRRLERVGSDEDWEWFQQQKLWPMDPRRLGKVGIAVCLAMYGAFAGFETADFLQRVIGKG